MQQTMSLRRSFSALRGLQAPRTMEYSLKEEKAGQFRLCFLEQAPGRAKQVGNAAFAGDRANAEALLTYLFENAVPYSQCPDVIADAWAMLSVKRGSLNEGAGNPAVDCG